MPGVAWVEWACGCDQAASTAEQLPATCPGHATPQLAPPEELPDDPADPIALGHWCPRRAGVRTPCPGAVS